ncbi:NUDIX hydrolase [Paenibacillus sp. UNC451MF]|uniref:NUDIX hydrolase n=1 Tax=Paenibacillus sp. UNC451MF TaxID=1449063 RepID=UPI0006918BC7|nr:NUDIX hydrolase [Paenibacillus sp. UNC451MF]
MPIRVRVACIGVRENKIVLMKKLIRSYFNFDQLTPPGGGVELHETLEQACIREMQEETGVIVASPKLRGILSYINHTNEGHSVTLLYVSTNLEGELITMEPEKHVPEWVDLSTLSNNERVPDYYRAMIARSLTQTDVFNATIEWLKPDGRFRCTIQ